VLNSYLDNQGIDSRGTTATIIGINLSLNPYFRNRLFSGRSLLLAAFLARTRT
jgi:hypothetical protein